jgi:hypothetical protein
MLTYLHSFRTHVLQSPHKSFHEVLGSAEVPGNTKICQFEQTLTINQNVLRLDVQMSLSRNQVQIAKSIQDLYSN